MNFSMITRTANHVGRVLKAHAPEILIGSGVVAGVAGTVYACVQTPKAVAIINEYKKNCQAIEECKQLCNREEYSEEDEKKDKIAITAKCIGGVAKTYVGPLAVEVLGVTSILAGAHIGKKRYVAMAGAFSALSTKYTNYRKAVAKKYGEEAEQDIYLGRETTTVEVGKVNNETGEVEKTTKTVTTVDPDRAAVCSFFFDEHLSCYVNAELNHHLAFDALARAQEIYERKGILIANEVNKMFGEKETGLGQCIGKINPKFIRDEKMRKKYIETFMPDEYVSFGFDMGKTDADKAFINMEEPSVLINPNYDGDILEFIDYVY